MNKAIDYHSSNDADWTDKMREASDIGNFEPTLTLQAPAEEADINVLIKRMGVKDGSRLPYWTRPGMIYGDFTEMPNDPVQVAEILRQGELAFQTLPADVRRRFDSGAHLYNWLHDPNNYDEAVRIGLLEPIQPEQPIPVSVIPPVTP